MDTQIKAQGDDTFILGANSFVYPAKLGAGEYVESLNTTNRGGLLKTRPGARSINLSYKDEEGTITINTPIPGTNVQGITMFKPSAGPMSLVCMVDGLVYVSQSPFKVYYQLTGLQFSPYSKYAAWAHCVQSTDYTPEGVLYVLDQPKNVLIIQDGSTRAAYWDGATAAHIDPSPSGEEFTRPGTDGTPMGLWMKWSNNRLWVSRDDQIFASDLGNPLKFADSQFLAEGRRFLLPDKCTGIVESPDQQGIICFTPETGVLIKSSIQDRSTWLSTPNFQQTVLPSIGCTSPRSIVQQHGLIWWMTTRGLIGLDDAVRLNVSSKLDVEDQEMSTSKARLSKDISMVCGSYYDNYLFHAVPYEHKVNTRIHVMDQAPMEEGFVNSWPSYWEGDFRPVEFARGIVGTKERVFCISKDADGVNRIWEFFQPNCMDNDIPITCSVTTRLHLFDSREYKRFRFAEVEMVGLHGKVSMLMAVKGIKGAFQKVGSKEIVATKGQVYYDESYGGYTGPSIYGTKEQIRVIRSNDSPEPSDCNAECIEEPSKRGLFDRGFQMYITWSGVGAIFSYRIFVQDEPDALEGRCEVNETGIRMLTPDGCGTTEQFSTSKAFEEFSSSQEFEEYELAYTAEDTSKISQEDADRKALARARWKVLSELGWLV